MLSLFSFSDHSFITTVKAHVPIPKIIDQKMKNTVLIVGAGAAGLMAAKELAQQEYEVTILEAYNRLGGRIWTINEPVFLQPVEAGAEFVHGDLQLTQQILNEANIVYHQAKGKTLRAQNGELKRQEDFTEGWDELMDKMQQLKEDTTIADFLNKNFPGEKYNGLRRSVQGFAEGFDLADINKASVLALRDEWSHEEGPQYRIEGGYQKLIDHLAKKCKENGCRIETSCVVKEVHWKKNEVKLVTSTGKTFEANKVIITVPIGVLQSELNAEAAIAFTPSIYDFFQAAKMIGYGTVTKILLQFNECFWKDDTSFILSDEKIPTWWTQAPSSYPLLTGWLNGAQSRRLQKANTASILEESIKSLASIFKISTSNLQQKLRASKVIDWSAQPFASGAYTYNLLETANARKIMNIPIQETIYFAGEGLYEGYYGGTVEAALVSGKQAAEKMLSI